ncbi:MAG: RidA family protein [Kiloniellaceae bacterium]
MSTGDKAKASARAAVSRNPATLWSVPEALRSVYSHACELRGGTRLLFVSGQFGVASDGAIESGFERQCEEAMANVERLLADAGMTIADVVKLNYFLVRAEDAPVLAEVRRRRWSSAAPPAVTVLVVSALARPEFLIEIEAVAAT